jgi:hypothetical protein
MDIRENLLERWILERIYCREDIRENLLERGY